MKFMETSAKNNLNVKKVFEILIKEIIKGQINEEKALKKDKKEKENQNLDNKIYKKIMNLQKKK